MKQVFIKLIMLLVISALASTVVLAQNTVSGKLSDKESGEPLIGINISVKGTTTGTISDADGNFSLTVSSKPPFTLVFSSIGFATQEIAVTPENVSTLNNLDIQLGQTVFMADEVVVSASRRFEKITEAPQTISIIKAQNIEELPSFNVGELVARQKGVDYVRSGVLGIGVNVRGFNSAFNPKNLQLTDNRFSTLVATGLPLGALNTVVKEDIERIEIVLGPSSALYGPNAGNGLVNTITKDPRTSEGTTMALGFGNQSVFTGRFRHAQVLSDKFAFKVTGEYTRGEEFDYVDTVYIGSGANATARPELDLDRTFESIRGEASVFYSLNDNSDFILGYGGSNSTNLAQTNAGRNQIRDWQIHYLHLRYVSPRLFAQLYHTWSSTDSTYAINQRTQNFWALRGAGQSEGNARANSYGNALFQDKSRRWNAEVQYNNNWGGYNWIIGSQYQLDLANSNGTYLLDNGGENISVNQIGFYTQLEKSFGTSGFKGVLSARADNHQLYGFNFIPKAALLYIRDSGTWRFTYGQGITAPTILNLEANIFGGLLLGNSQGFTLNNGRTIQPLGVEKIQTFELGYKGKIAGKLFLDVNAYYNLSENFLSPALVLTGVTQRGNEPISNFQAVNPGALVLTYVNFGKVDTYGFDMGLNYYVTNKFNIALNYSYFGFSLDKEDPANDFRGTGQVLDTDLPINTPANKLSLALNYSSKRWFGSIFTRWVEAYDFFSGINVAAATNRDITVGGSPVVENARVGRTWNYGPLGGFVNVDVSAGYRFGNGLQISGQVVNIFDSEVREFVASPAIGRLFSIEFKANIAPKKK